MAVQSQIGSRCTTKSALQRQEKLICQMVDRYDAHSRRPSHIPRANTREGMKRYDGTETHGARQSNRPT